MELTDSVTLEGVRRTRDGYLVGNARIARTGIYHYGGAELGKPELEMVRVYRPEDEVFEQAAMTGFAHRPITNDHPRESVTAKTWKDVAVGMIGGDIARDGSFLSVPLALMDAQAIEDYESGKREVSAGYTCEIEWASGTAPDGEAYDAIQRKIRPNHLAMVDRGRAGPECRIGDGASRTPPVVTPTLPPSPQQGGRTMAEDIRTVVVDGLTISTTGQGAEVITKLQRQLADAASSTEAANRRITDAETAHRAALDAANGQVAALRSEMTRALEAKDGEIAGMQTAHAGALAAKDGEIAALQTQTSDTALDARVAQRSALLAQVAPIMGAGFNATGMTDAAIRKATVVKAFGAGFVDDGTKGEAFFDGAFNAVVAMNPRPTAPNQTADTLRGAFAAGPTLAADAGGKTAWQINQDRVANAWKNPDQKEAV